MKTLFSLATGLAFLVCASAYAAPADPVDSPRRPVAASRFDVAITVDDLPFHGGLPPGTTRLGVAESYLATLKGHGVPEAYGFVNAAKLEREPGSDAVLTAWRRAGYPLGNHGYTHLNLDRAVSFADWQADVVANEPVLSDRMGMEDWHWFRFPNLSAGARRDEALAWLRTRGYRVADVSLDFSDWAYTEAYERCMTKGDNAAIATMKREYLNSVDRGIATMRAQSMQLYGRQIPLMLLTHLGAWSAATLPDVLSRLDGAGAHYVTLAQAQNDPAYVRPGGRTLFVRVAAEKNIVLSTPSADDAGGPRRGPEAMCR